MIMEDQKAVFRFLETPLSYGLDGELETMETHISRVFLIDGKAFKLKRAVKLPYVDFSTPALRLDACKKEVEYNSLSAPGLYLGVRRITREADGSLAFDGEGDVVDAVVEMVRFEQESLMDHLADAGQLTRQIMEKTARKIVAFHAVAPTVETSEGAANIAGVLDINESGFATSHVFSPAELAPFNAAFRMRLEKVAAILDRRGREGRIKRCHGDLHLRNICVVDGQPLLFDCIEFNRQIATIDVLYDLAFLLMDLWHQGFAGYANLVANRYLDETDNEDGFVVLPFFMAIRAAVRAHVTATLVEEGGMDPEALTALARSYFELARELMREEPPRLVAIGGFSGSGKSTVAEVLAARVGPPPGARIVESDRLRKHMFGVPAEARLPAEAYTREVGEKVYAAMTAQSHDILAAGGSVVTDAVFADPARRAHMEEGAEGTGASFTGIWLDLPVAALVERIEGRGVSASDADVEILHGQIAKGTGELSWTKVDGSGSAEAVTENILAIVDGTSKLS